MLDNLTLDELIFGVKPQETQSVTISQGWYSDEQKFGVPLIIQNS